MIDVFTRRFPYILLFCLGGGVSPARAQRWGVVENEAGAPVVGAYVLLVDSMGSTIGAAVSDTAGRWAVADRLATRADRVRFEHVAYATLEVAAASAFGHALRLASGTLDVDPLIVRGAAVPCPRRGEAAADATWHAAAVTYSTATDTLGFDVILATHAGFVRPEERGATSPFQVASRSELQMPGESRAAEAWIARYGYVAPIGAMTHRDPWPGDFGDVAFARVFDVAAAHFAAPAFGAAHVFFDVVTSPAGASVRFCPRRGAASGLRGVMTIGRDHTIRDVVFAFMRDGGATGAGARVEFAEAPNAAEPDRPHLVARRSLFWRPIASTGRYHQRETLFVDWMLSESAAMPAIEDWRLKLLQRR